VVSLRGGLGLRTGRAPRSGLAKHGRVRFAPPRTGGRGPRGARAFRDEDERYIQEHFAPRGEVRVNAEKLV